MTDRYPSILFASVVAALSLLLVSGACTAVGVEAGKRILTDASGVTIPIVRDAKKIVTLAPNLTEIVCSLGLGENLVGVSSYSNYPKEVNALPKVGGFAALNVEMIASLTPDIVLATMDGNSEIDINKLRSLGIAVFCVFPNDMQGLLKAIGQLGKLLGREDSANGLVANIEQSVRNVRASAEKLGKARGRPKVLITLDTKPIVSASTQTFIGELVQIAGGNNVIGSNPIRYPRLSLETIIASAPDVILATGHGSHASVLADLRQLERWKDIPAIKNGRVYSLDPDLATRQGPRVVEALKIIQDHLFPDEHIAPGLTGP
ncbi:MAG: cobalamin-binding protein [Candidatus Coatesbacteria bacterium]|nr:cobalamin-binding protein [Candidatus Coatesbacteria bacterium]